MKRISVFFAHLSSMKKESRIRASVIKLYIAPLLIILLLGCAGKPVQPEKIEKMSEKEAYEQLFWGMGLASYYVGWEKTNRESFIRKVTLHIFEYHPEWNQQTRAAMLNAAIRFPSDQINIGIKDMEEYSDIFSKTWLWEVFKDPRSTETFLGALKVKKCIINRMFPAFIRMGKADTEGLLIEAFEECHGGIIMAENFVNCGNQKLMVAGMIWLREHGFKMTRSSNHEYYKWGSQKIENGK